jgi:hypothetical protein
MKLILRKLWKRSVDRSRVQASHPLVNGADGLAAWLQSLDLHSVSIVHVLATAVKHAPELVIDSWRSACNAGDGAAQLSALFFRLTNFSPHSYQVPSTPYVLLGLIKHRLLAHLYQPL